MLEKWIYNQPIRNSMLFFFLVFIIVPALLVGVFSFVQTKQVVEQSTFNTLEYLSDAQEKAIDNWVKSRKNFIEGLAQNDQLNTVEYQATADLLRNSLKMDQNFRGLILADPEGIVQVEPTNQNKEQSISVSDREYFQQAIKGKTYVSELLLSRNKKNPVLVFATPVKNKNNIVGVLIGAVHIDVITRLVEQNFPGKHGESYLVNEKGLMISQSKFAQQDTALELEMKKGPIEGISRGISGQSIYKNYLNKKVFGVYRWLPEIQMGLVVEKEYNTALLEYGLVTYLKVAAASIVIIGLFILYATIYSRRLSQPLERLANEVNHIAEGNFRSIIDLRANREFQELARSINYMSSNLLEKNNQLNDLILQLELNAEHLHEEKDKLARISITDELTGLYNRRYINQELYRLIHLGNSLQKSISVLSLDLDRFKRVNDTFGHAAGDVVLKEFAELLCYSKRGSDVVGRFGGEEFIVIIPFVNGKQVKEIAERIRQAVSAFTFDSKDNKIQLTVSIGAATLIPSPDEPIQQVAEKLLKVADEGLYQAKNSGRNKVIHIDLTNKSKQTSQD